MIYHDGHHDLKNLGDMVARATKTLKKHRGEFDSIIVTGISGIVVGVPVSLALGVPLVILRKESDCSHAAYSGWVNMSQLGRRTCFLDDLVSGGATKRRCRDKAQEHGSRMVSQYLYRDDAYSVTP